VALIKDFFFDGKINSLQMAMSFTFVILFRRAEASLYKNEVVYFYNDKISCGFFDNLADFMAFYVSCGDDNNCFTNI